MSDEEGLPNNLDAWMGHHWAYQIPELKSYVDSFVQKIEDETYAIADMSILKEIFLAGIRDTAWWTGEGQHEPNRNMDMLQHTDPETYNALIKEEAERLKGILEGAGYRNVSRDTLELLGEASLRSAVDGWGDAEVKHNFTYGWIPEDQKELGTGSITEQADDLVQLALGNGITLSATEAERLAADLWSGTKDATQARAGIYADARVANPWLSEDEWDRIESSGSTLDARFLNTRTAVADAWGLPNADNLHISDPWFQSNMTYQAEDGTTKMLDPIAAGRLARSADGKTPTPQYARTAEYKRKQGQSDRTILELLGAVSL
ncbi:MAG: hypothetical protein CMF29_08720 [Kiritimatiellaceae bacterium]|nr:hypothetical protein [Kiritimatiellaceae bacterium]